MQNKRVENRFREIIKTAGTVFGRKGFRRTLISDIAQEIGVSQGTIYNYFESKEALFEFTLQALYREDYVLPTSLPVPTPPPGQELLQSRILLQEYRPHPNLVDVLERPAQSDIVAEITKIVRELFWQNVRYGTLIRMIETSGDDYPKLYDFYYGDIRGMTIQRWEEYLRARVEQGLIRPLPDPAVTARSIIELSSWWSRNAKGDSGPEVYDDHRAIDGIIDLVVNSLIKEPAHVQ